MSMGPAIESIAGGGGSGSGVCGKGSSPAEDRPGIFVIGAPNVGKQTLLARLLSVDSEAFDLSSGVLCQGWTIQTKYYSAELSIWAAHLLDSFDFGALPNSRKLEALVMVFDLTEESSFTALQKWAANVDIKNFEILLCIGNKADLVPDHYAHAQYRRLLQRHAEYNEDSHPDCLDYGIYELEGSSLLGHEEPLVNIKKSCMEWCREHNIEFIEACASNESFDKCLSIDGDIQGVERLYGALSAYMWPDMILKSGNRTIPLIIENGETTESESDYEIQYEVLSEVVPDSLEGAGDITLNEEIIWTTAQDVVSADAVAIHQHDSVRAEAETSVTVDDVSNGCSSDATSARNKEVCVVGDPGDPRNAEQCTKEEKKMSEDGRSSPKTDPAEFYRNFEFPDSDDESHPGFGNLDRLLGEIHNMRDNLRLMPDSQRREMAAQLALKMAAMFGNSSDEDDI